jgi:membrane-associated phospholipid phosphatase
VTATTTAAISTRHQRDALGALVVGLFVLAVGIIIVRDGTVPGWEASIFHAVNNLPGALYRPLWPFQQLGALAIGPVVALVAVLCRRFRLAIAALVATIAKLVFERAVKVIASRQRPGTSIGHNVHLRGDVTVTGESFVSGHAVLIAALAGIVTPYLPGRWKIAPWAVVVMVMVTRVYVGAHNPLDVVCGAGLGLAIAGAINLVSRPGVGSDDRR